jgi:hypothetical protein
MQISRDEGATQVKEQDRPQEPGTGAKARDRGAERTAALAAVDRRRSADSRPKLGMHADDGGWFGSNGDSRANQDAGHEWNKQTSHAPDCPFSYASHAYALPLILRVGQRSGMSLDEAGGNGGSRPAAPN